MSHPNQSSMPTVPVAKAGSVPGQVQGLQDASVTGAASLDVSAFIGQYIVIQFYGGDGKFWFAPTATAAEQTGDQTAMTNFVPSFAPNGVEVHRIVPGLQHGKAFLHYNAADGTTPRLVVHRG